MPPAGSIGGLNFEFGRTETHQYQDSNPTFRYKMPRRKGILGVIHRLTATVNIATAEDVAVDEGTARLLTQAGAQWNEFQHYPQVFTGRDHLRISRRMIGKGDFAGANLVQNDLADASSQTTDIAVEWISWFTDPFLDESQKDMYTGPASPEDTFEFVYRWETQATNSNSDPGTYALVRDTNNSNNAVTFNSGPVLETTPMVMPAAPVKPYALLEVLRRVEGPFTSAQDPFDIEINHAAVTLLTMLASVQDGDQRNLYDGINTVNYGDRADFQNIQRSALSVEDRARHPLASANRPGELGIRHSQGSIGTGLDPVGDLNSSEIALSVAGPSGNGNIYAYWVNARRRGLTVGERIRRNVETIPQGVKALARDGGMGGGGRGGQ